MMRKFEFHLVNVFAETRFGGNPLCVFPKADGLSDDEMQAIAKQFNLSETVFIHQPSDTAAVANLRIFTPNYELPLAGHPTLGAAFVLSQRLDLPNNFTLNTVAKPVQICTNGSQISLSLRGFSAQQEVDLPMLADACGLPMQALIDGFYMNAGAAQLIVQLQNAQHLRSLRVDLSKLNALYQHSPNAPTAAPSLYLWSACGDVIYARKFFEQDGILLEDSGTGSAAANLGAYFIHTNRYPIATTIHQGDDMGRPNRLTLSVDRKQNISVGGNVIAVGRGEFWMG